MARSVQILEETGIFTSAPDRPGGSLGTGLFSTYLDSDQPRLEAGPASVPVADAIAWGRANAPTVVVLVCDDAGGGAYFSAGEVPPAPDAMGALLQWPDEGGLLAARRCACHATSGLPSQDVRPPDGVWEVGLDVFGPAPIDLADFVSRWVEAISRHDSVTGILGPATASPQDDGVDEPQSEFWTSPVLPEPFMSARLTFEADTRSQAELVAVDLGTRAAKLVLDKVDANRAQGLFCRARAMSSMI